MFRKQCFEELNVFKLLLPKAVTKFRHKQKSVLKSKHSPYAKEADFEVAYSNSRRNENP